MTLRNPSRRVPKRLGGIAHAEWFTTSAKTKLFAVALLPRALTLNLNLMPAPTAPVPVIDSPATIATTLVFDATQPVPLLFEYQGYVIKPQHSRADEARLAEAAKRSTTGAPTRRFAPADPDLEAKRSLAQQAADAYGIDWRLLEAVWQVESGKSWHTGVRSSAGAQGPMQFMPGTWRRYGVDGNGDGAVEATNVYDALSGGARYLAANGAADGNIDRALLAYNHAGWYVQKVKNVMDGI